MTWAIPAAYALLLALLVYRYATRRPRLSNYAPLVTGPLVSVIIPARDEAVNIEACVRSAVATDLSVRHLHHVGSGRGPHTQ